jgi:hypothetical protein
VTRGRRIALATAALPLALGAVTLLALEGGEVVVVRTLDAGGAPRETRTWIADEADGAWVEAASRERPFLYDVHADPHVELWRQGRWRRCVAVAAANPAGHERIRRLLREKYGWKDRWIALVADTRRSVAVRLACEDA